MASSSEVYHRHWVLWNGILSHLWQLVWGLQLLISVPQEAAKCPCRPWRRPANQKSPYVSLQMQNPKQLLLAEPSDFNRGEDDRIQAPTLTTLATLAHEPRHAPVIGFHMTCLKGGTWQTSQRSLETDTICLKLSAKRRTPRVSEHARLVVSVPAEEVNGYRQRCLWKPAQCNLWFKHSHTKHQRDILWRELVPQKIHSPTVKWTLSPPSPFPSLPLALFFPSF